MLLAGDPLPKPARGIDKPGPGRVRTRHRAGSHESGKSVLWLPVNCAISRKKLLQVPPPPVRPGIGE